MKAKAVIEVVVVFSLTLLLIALVGFSPIPCWELDCSASFDFDLNRLRSG